MPSITLFFSGIFVCRLAISPDPFDEPRGRRGMTRAYPGEANLDRIIQTDASNVNPRSYCQNPGVSVFEVSDGAPECLIGQPVVLEAFGATEVGKAANSPCFEGRDGIVAADRKEPIIPLIIRVGNSQAPLLRRVYTKDLLDFSNQNVKPNGKYGGEVLEGEMKNLFAEYSKKLENRFDEIACRAKSENEMVAEILRDRVSNRVRVSDTFKREGPMSIAVSSAQAVGTIDAKRLGLKLALDPNSNWPLDLTFDHFDLDCLCGLVVGSLTVPLA